MPRRRNKSITQKLKTTTIAGVGLTTILVVVFLGLLIAIPLGILVVNAYNTTGGNDDMGGSNFFWQFSIGAYDYDGNVVKIPVTQSIQTTTGTEIAKFAWGISYEITATTEAVDWDSVSVSITLWIELWEITVGGTVDQPQLFENKVRTYDLGEVTSTSRVVGIPDATDDSGYKDGVAPIEGEITVATLEQSNFFWVQYPEDVVGHFLKIRASFSARAYTIYGKLMETSCGANAQVNIAIVEDEIGITGGIVFTP